MPVRLLVGPVSPERARDFDVLARAGTAVCFGPDAGPTWRAVRDALPPGFEPDALLLDLSYASVPAWCFDCPLPAAALAPDWDLQWTAFLHVLPRCSLSFTDPRGVAALRAAGVAHAEPARLFGLQGVFADAPPPDPSAPRDIDVLFVGNVNPAVQGTRLPWLGRLARMASRHRVLVASGVSPAEHRALLLRTRVAFNRSLKGEWNQRVCEAASCGALLLTEAGNADTADVWRDGENCALYTPADLEAVAERYLADEGLRAAVAAGGAETALGHTFAAELGRIAGVIEARLPELRARRASLPPLSADDALRLRAWQAGADPALEADLRAAAESWPWAAAALAARLRTVDPRQAAGLFHRALSGEPASALDGLGLAECLYLVGERGHAADGARLLLATLAATGVPAGDDLRPLPDAAFGPLRCAWERAGHEFAGDPAGRSRARAEVLRSRLHLLLGRATGDLYHFHEAARCQPNAPGLRAVLGCELARAGRAADALSHLRAEVEANPFDSAAARAMYQCLLDAGDLFAAARLAADRRQLRLAAPNLVAAEPWAVPPDASGFRPRLASIVIPCCNEAYYTGLCLDALARSTRRPYELLLIDNGSTDGTAELFERERSRVDGAERVVVIRNGENLGFARGTNQGLRAARGGLLVLLNNDTVPPDGWLEALEAAMLASGAAAVGPTSNYTAPPQLVEAGYGDIDGMRAFAAARRREYGDRTLAVPRLTGFCMAIDRAALTAVGLLDERFGVGFFEDDDWCVRARRAGFGLAVALGAFVHHFGSRTFAGLGIDTASQLEDNLRLFREKWGDAVAGGYVLPPKPAPAPAEPATPATADEPFEVAPEPPAETVAGAVPEDPAVEAPAPEPAPAPDPVVVAFEPPPTPEPVVLAPTPANAAQRRLRPGVTLCVIARDEEANIRACLESALGLVDEMVVVDTGSADRTREIAASLGARVEHFAWIDDFAAARNASLSHATREWVFWLDADDRIDAGNRERLRALFAALPDANVAYSMKCRCLPDPQSGTATVVDHVRLFRNMPEIRWRYRVHEQILGAVRAAGGDVVFTDCVIDHTGYVDAALRARKLQRDLRLLEAARKDTPHDPFVLFNLGAVYTELGELERAERDLRASLHLSSPRDSIVRKLYSLLAHVGSRRGQPHAALEACEDGLRLYPADPELLLTAASLHLELGRHHPAIHALDRLAKAAPEACFASVAEGLATYRASHLRAAALVRRNDAGDAVAAERLLRANVADHPAWLPSWHDLARLLLNHSRWDDVEAHAARMESRHGGAAPWAWRGESLFRRERHEEAAALLERGRAEHPRDVPLLNALSHALLKLNREAEAEGVLATILELEPGHVNARQNLDCLLWYRERDRRDRELFGGDAPPA